MHHVEARAQWGLGSRGAVGLRVQKVKGPLPLEVMLWERVRSPPRHGPAVWCRTVARLLNSLTLAKGVCAWLVCCLEC
jgi:hypothetical protein